MASHEDKDKTTRLSTLSQDVIAVPKKGAQPASSPAARAIPPAQDVFNMPPPVSPRPVVPPPAPAAAAAATRLPPSLLALFAGVVLVLGGFAWKLYQDNAALRAATAAPAAPSVTAGSAAGNAVDGAALAAAEKRLAKLEATLGAAAASEGEVSPSAQASILQLGAAVRGLRDDLDRLSNNVGKLEAQLAESRAQAAVAAKDARTALATAEQSAARIGQLETAKPATAAAAPATADVQAQLKGLTQKTDKLGNDIRQLYRVLESQSR